MPGAVFEAMPADPPQEAGVRRSPDAGSARHCAACGYDLAGALPGASRCPECGAEAFAWTSRWLLRLAHLGLTLQIWGMLIAAAAWMVNNAVRSWLVATGNSPNSNLAVPNTTMALACVPGLIIAAGLVLLAAGVPGAGAARRAAWVVAGAGAAALCLLVGERTALLSGYSTTPAWLSSQSVRGVGWWALAAIAPLATGVELAILSRSAESLALPRLAAWCRRFVWWAPCATLLAIGAYTGYAKLGEIRSRTPAVPVSTVSTFVGSGGLSPAVGPGAVTDPAQPGSPPRPAQAGPSGRGGLPGGPRTVVGSPVRVPPPQIQSPAWYWISGVGVARAALYGAAAGLAAAVWLVALVVRLRIRDALGARRDGIR